MPCWEDVLSRYGIFYGSNFDFTTKNDSLDLPFYFTLSFFCCFRNANSLLGKRSTAGCFCLINPKKVRIFGIFPKRKHCTIVSFVQCGYGCGSQIWTDDLRVMSSSNASEKSHATQSFSDFTYRFCRRDDDADVDLSSTMTKWGTHFPLFLEKCFYKHGKYFWMNSSCYLITASEKSDVFFTLYFWNFNFFIWLRSKFCPP